MITKHFAMLFAAELRFRMVNYKKIEATENLLE